MEISQTARLSWDIRVINFPMLLILRQSSLSAVHIPEASVGY